MVLGPLMNHVAKGRAVPLHLDMHFIHTSIMSMLTSHPQPHLNINCYAYLSSQNVSLQILVWYTDNIYCEWINFVGEHNSWIKQLTILHLEYQMHTKLLYICVGLLLNKHQQTVTRFHLYWCNWPIHELFSPTKLIHSCYCQQNGAHL